MNRDAFLRVLFDTETEIKISSLCDLSVIQESFRFRSKRRASLLAQHLLDPQGDLKKEELTALLQLLEETPYFIYPDGYNDCMISRHILRTLNCFQEENIVKIFRKFQKPLCHQQADKLIRDTLGLSSNTAISTCNIRQAVLAACLTVLRQNVGSCFATAPAILIQSEQLELFLADLHELLMTGKLKRTFGGVEFMAPLSPSTGSGDLKKTVSEKKHLLCPGLMEAFTAAGLIDSRLSLDHRMDLSVGYASFILQERGAITIEMLLREVLIEKLHVSKEDLPLALQQLETIPIRGKLSHLPISSLTEAKRDACEKFLQKEKEARAAFKGVVDNALLKAWEYTIASFSEVKMEFSRWNLYISLGFDVEEKGGIGAVLYRQIQAKLEDKNKQIETFQKNYEIAFDQLRATELLLKQASTESDIRRLRAEHQSRLYHMQACLEMRDQNHQAASRYSSLYSFLLKQYDALFKQYFQEIYDAEMQDIKKSFYDDSPAGFRLVYKHGRNDASLWTLIYTPRQYIDALVDFFLSTESQVASTCDWEEGSQEIVELTTVVVSHIQTPEFLKTALLRMAKGHKAAAIIKDPLAHLDKLEKKPWAYTSGGSLHNLLKTYFRRENEITEESRWVESPMDLLIFILESIKLLPPLETNFFLADVDKRMLSFSPTHAFLLQPGWEGFKEGWQEEGFTYTWVRDKLLLPRQYFYSLLHPTFSEQIFLAEQFATFLPKTVANHFLSHFSPTKSSIVELRRNMAVSLPEEFLDPLDSFLYQMLPLIPTKKAAAHLNAIFEEKIPLPLLNTEWIGSKTFKEIAAFSYVQAKGTSFLPFDLHHFLTTRFASLGLAPPKPLVFADTNWTNYYFSFLVNPGTNHLELWRTDITGTTGSSMMHLWKSHLDGTSRDPWGLLLYPHEYLL